MLFYLLLIACAIPVVLLLIDFYNQISANKKKHESMEKHLKDEEQRENGKNRL